jgi:4'-phosphopantetheinyl transferase
MIRSEPQLWQLAPADWRLGSQDVHVWSVLLNQPPRRVAQLQASLCESELCKSEQFRFEADRRRFIVGRGLLREILGVYLAADPRQISLRYGPFGKPELADPTQENLCFNLSHSGQLALYAISCGRELGVDLEEVCFLAERDAIARRFFSEKENVRLRQAATTQQQRLFYNFWTRKEAVLKCTGEGIAAEERAREIQDRFKGVVRELIPADGYTASLAIKGDAFQLCYWQWQELASSCSRIR